MSRHLSGLDLQQLADCISIQVPLQCVPKVTLHLLQSLKASLILRVQQQAHHILAELFIVLLKNVNQVLGAFGNGEAKVVLLVSELSPATTLGHTI
jgi:hypothetical protein